MVQRRQLQAEKIIVSDVFAIMRVLSAEIRRVGSGVQLTVSQFSTLQLLERGDMPVGELARALHVAMPTVTQSTDSLVSKGLVERYADERDRRHVRLRITNEGRDLLLDCNGSIEEYVANVIAGWPDDRKDEFATMLDEVRDMFLRAEAVRPAS